MRDRFDRVLSALITVCALATAGGVLYRSVFATPAGRRARKPEYVSDWKNALAVGQRIGNDSAAIVLVDIADLQCPVCRAFYNTVSSVRKDYPSNVALVHVSYPLPYHPQAMAAARAAECAAAEGRFEPWVDVVYKKQDSLGIKSWGSFAHEAGLTDSAAISRCAADTLAVPRIERAVAFADHIGVTGTPTIIINGWRLPGSPTKERLRTEVEALLRGENPFKGSHWSEK